MFLFPVLTWAAPIPLPNINIGVSQANSPAEMNTSLQVLILLTVLSLAPSLLIMMTSFTRIVIVLSFVRNALGTQQAPPTQLIVGLALFLTFFVMAPTFTKINDNAVKPFTAGKISQEEAMTQGMAPLRDFMFRQTRQKDLALFVQLAKLPRPKNRADIPTHVLISSFIISEIKTAFQMGFAVFVPFLVLDIVIASLLMSMGMMMLPPVMISLPFKILLFILVDGWSLVARSLVMSFH
ncbi:MAG: flagellar biosynthetic protein FliP [Candidatus Margulisiibacteriota bacterium]|nr:MAG: flagellar biosynthetic protein FliP [Candidatus Margulisbacteria bacterium GWD2_39_127]OGI05250.1 MAG: flagellar biosynthetic protein FliP [Candidatus Margulisbacteria bacterium GWF2_38_17]OGI06301.1 MAG: flagellar biosynthetic protein FliP [Candidatus Margulisbacteria bacterium GWE2_39_32]PZM78959.1 MAG: flagellar biosynthetic protein FliP [Candidatus Margulisiibacteriota bacterium]HAR64512.1 flagellar biosynthetic protein FliP [Candidatus Margulisiibacteriota bacterium]